MARENTLAALLLALLAFAGPSLGGETGAAAVDQALRDLAGDAVAVFVAARAGDADLESAAYLRRERGVSTVVLCVEEPAPGDGRMVSLLGARLVSLGCAEFGESRDAAEALTLWGGREEAVARLAAALEGLRPRLVLFAPPRDEDDGLGRAVADLVGAAFAAAETDGLLLVSCPEGEATVLFNVGRVHPVRGRSFAEMAARARGAVPPPPGTRFRAYRRAGGGTGEEGGDAEGIYGEVPRAQWIVREELRSGTRAEILDRLVELAGAAAAERPPEEKLSRAIAAVLGIAVRVDLPDRVAIEGEDLEIVASVVNGGWRAVSLEGASASGDGSLSVSAGIAGPSGALAPGGAREVPIRVRPREAGRHAIRLTARLAVPATDVRFTVEEEVDLGVLPRRELAFRPGVHLLRPVLRSATFHLEVRNHAPEPAELPLRIEPVGTDRVRVEAPESVTLEPGEVRVVPLHVAALDDVGEGLFTLRAVSGALVAETLFRVLDVEAPGEMRVGVVATSERADESILRALGIEPELLSDEELVTGDLARFQTILLGPRAFGVRPVLRQMYRRLLEFVRQGGNLVVTACRTEDWSPAFAPARLALGGDRVTREDAPVVFPDSEHRLLHFPNEVTDEDFRGWVRERGSCFPAEWDPEVYSVVLRTADPGRPLLPGILVGEVGEGTFIYSALSFAAQLETLNPAALKMLGNALSYNWRR